MPSSNVSLVQRMYDCFARGDVDTLRREVFAPDVIWHFPGYHPLAGDKRGVDEVVAFFNALNRTNIRVELIKMDDWGGDTVVETHRGIGQAGGATLNVLNCTHYVIRDGRIAEVQVFEANMHEAEIYMWANYPLKPIPDRLA